MEYVFSTSRGGGCTSDRSSSTSRAGEQSHGESTAELKPPFHKNSVIFIPLVNTIFHQVATSSISKKREGSLQKRRALSTGVTHERWIEETKLVPLFFLEILGPPE